MKLREKIKRFWTLDVHGHEGFTLVELIIVIAILAILSSVAVVGYSSYVEKANKAADDQLLYAINQAFRSACIENMCDVFDISAAEWDMDTMTVTSVRNNTEDPIVTAFTKYFEVSNPKFKVITSLAYDSSLGMFINGVVVEINGIKIAVSQELAEALQNNNLSAIGASALMGKVDAVANVAELLLSPDTPDSIIFKLIYGDEQNPQPYLNSLAASLNMDPTSQEFLALVADEEGDLKASVLANSLVLTAAQKTEGMDTSFLGTAGSVSALKSKLDNPETATDAMAELALTYGMYTAYVKSDAAKPEGFVDNSAEILDAGTLTGMADLMKVVESSEFQKYLNSDAGQADLNAYMASMEIVNDSVSQSPEATMDILTNGFTDEELVDALGDLMNPPEE